jgi:hypothetical protein
MPKCPGSRAGRRQRDFRLWRRGTESLIISVMAPQETEPSDEIVVLGPSLAEVVLLERALRSLLDAESALSELRAFYDRRNVPLREVRAAVTAQRRLIRGLM